MINLRKLCKLYITACEIELQTFKPGNVSIYADGHDMTVADFADRVLQGADGLADTADAVVTTTEEAFQALDAMF